MYGFYSMALERNLHILHCSWEACWLFVRNIGRLPCCNLTCGYIFWVFYIKLWKAAKSVVSQVKMILSSAVGIHSDSYCFQYFFCHEWSKEKTEDHASSSFCFRPLLYIFNFLLYIIIIKGLKNQIEAILLLSRMWITGWIVMVR